MQRLSSWLVIAILVASAAAMGCGSGKERGKNLDYDRPKATDKGK